MALVQEQKERLMAYLDGELEEQERTAFEQVLLSSTELQQELAQFQKLQSLMNRVRIPEPKLELWDEYPRRGYEKLFRVIGWLLLAAGGVLVVSTAEYLLWRSDEIPGVLKLGLTLVGLGLGILLVMVVLRRTKESKTDRYKEIVR